IIILMKRILKIHEKKKLSMYIRQSWNIKLQQNWAPFLLLILCKATQQEERTGNKIRDRPCFFCQDYFKKTMPHNCNTCRGL
ncbi:hypothetical protein STEG23_017816, partial [Scotinomys teguina]